MKKAKNANLIKYKLYCLVDNDFHTLKFYFLFYFNNVVSLSVLCVTRLHCSCPRSEGDV